MWLVRPVVWVVVSLAVLWLGLAWCLQRVLGLAQAGGQDAY